MKWLIIGFLIVISSVTAFATPDIPSSVWFEGNATPHYTQSRFNVNWSEVSNEEISNYAVYVTNSLDGKTILKSANTSATGFFFPGANGMKYVFKISAINTSGTGGLNATSDWIFVDSVAPEINFYSNTPANNAYVKTKKIQINISVKGSNSTTLINNGSEATLTAGSISHKVKVDMVSDTFTAFISLDGGVPQLVEVKNRYLIGGVLVYVDSISYVGGVYKVGIGIAESGLNLILDWNGANESNVFTYYGTFWNVSKNLADERPYTYYIWANDSVGNTGVSEKRTVRYNSGYQQIDLISPKNTTYNTTEIPLEYSYFDTGTYSCWYEYNKINKTLENCANSAIVAPRNNASKITLWIRTSSGNLIAYSTTFTTLIPPTIFANSPENNSVLNPPSLSGNSTLPLGVKTDVISKCGYSTERGTDFDSMTLFKITNSTVHNTTINITDSSEYKIFVRCKDNLGNANMDDYYITFLTLNGSNKLLIDPEETVIKNGYVYVELLSGVTKKFSVPLRNTASSKMEKLNVSINGTGKPYINAKLSSNTIPANSEIMLDITITPNKTNSFSSDIRVLSGALETRFSISAAVYDISVAELNTLKDKRIKLTERLHTLKRDNEVDMLISQTEALLTDVSDSISSYNNGAYSKAKEKADALKLTLSGIEERTAELEVLQKADEKNKDDLTQVIENNSKNTYTEPPKETTNEPSVGSNKIFVAIGIIILTVVIVVLATSILPDDYGKEKEDAEQEPYIS